MKALPLLTCITLGVLLVGQAQSQERSIKRSDLPPAVAKTAATLSHGATVRGYSRAVDNGQTLYEVALRVNGHGKDVTIDSTGAVVEEEEEVAFARLPAAVQAGLRAGAGAGKIRKVESLTKHGQLVAYEAQVVTAGKRSEVQVGPDGKPLATPQ